MQRFRYRFQTLLTLGNIRPTHFVKKLRSNQDILTQTELFVLRTESMIFKLTLYL